MAEEMSEGAARSSTSPSPTARSRPWSPPYRPPASSRPSSSDGPFTVFAPTDDAFAAALDALGLTADELLADTDTLTSILTYHVVAGEVDAATVVTLDGQSAETVNGAEIDISVVDGNVMINDATVIIVDVAGQQRHHPRDRHRPAPPGRLNTPRGGCRSPTGTRTIRHFHEHRLHPPTRLPGSQRWSPVRLAHAGPSIDPENGPTWIRHSLRVRPISNRPTRHMARWSTGSAERRSTSTLRGK